MLFGSTSLFIRPFESVAPFKEEPSFRAPLKIDVAITVQVWKVSVNTASVWHQPVWQDEALNAAWTHTTSLLSHLLLDACMAHTFTDFLIFPVSWKFNVWRVSLRANEASAVEICISNVTFNTEYNAVARSDDSQQVGRATHDGETSWWIRHAYSAAAPTPIVLPLWEAGWSIFFDEQRKQSPEAISSQISRDMISAGRIYSRNSISASHDLYIRTFHDPRWHLTPPGNHGSAQMNEQPRPIFCHFASLLFILARGGPW